VCAASPHAGNDRVNKLGDSTCGTCGVGSGSDRNHATGSGAIDCP